MIEQNSKITIIERILPEKILTVGHLDTELFSGRVSTVYFQWSVFPFLLGRVNYCIIAYRG